MKKSGSVTVFLSLLLTVIAAFILTLESYAKGMMEKSGSAFAADNAIRSCFAEYNRELYKRFHILLIDSSYKASESGIDKVAGHFLTYMQGSMVQNEECLATIPESHCAAESGGEYIRDSAIHYARKICGDEAGLADYSLEVLGHHFSPAEGAYRVGEIEYVIFGLGADEDNIEESRSLYENCPELTYREHLRACLEDVPDDVIVQRLCELMTEYMRANGSPGFDLETCYNSLTFSVKVNGSHIGEYGITKEYGYDLPDT